MTTNGARSPFRGEAGYSLVELVVTFVIVGLVASLAVPSVRGEIERLRVHGALNRVVSEIYRARMAAVESGAPTLVVLHPGAGGCVERVGVATLAGGAERSISSNVLLPGLCMRHTGDSVLVFDARGMLKPPARSIRVSHGGVADSVVLSIAGRIRRTYRHRRPRERGSGMRVASPRSFEPMRSVSVRSTNPVVAPPISIRWSPRHFSRTRYPFR